MSPCQWLAACPYVRSTQEQLNGHQTLTRPDAVSGIRSEPQLAELNQIHASSHQPVFLCPARGGVDPAEGFWGGAAAATTDARI
ncbi:hypothetical protein AK830_g2715 [Neonectria ditissima]|uniref:Uncharacterized protein n=1 Tax=Neonectria ditissima TaxID=78410 RepID=A0A0P7BQZ1_9HYPO|nr:hypothetical protein AK830_g2715 [Neonectria ditissima]